MGEEKNLGDWDSDPATRFQEFDLANALTILTQGLMDAQRKADEQLVTEFDKRDEATLVTINSVEKDLLDMGLSPNRFLVKEADLEIQTEYKVTKGENWSIGGKAQLGGGLESESPETNVNLKLVPENESGKSSEVGVGESPGAGVDKLSQTKNDSNRPSEKTKHAKSQGDEAVDMPKSENSSGSSDEFEEP